MQPTTKCYSVDIIESEKKSCVRKKVEKTLDMTASVIILYHIVLVDIVLVDWIA